MDSMTDAELAILSLLNSNIHTDTDLHEQIEARGLRRWTAIGTSSMYYILDKLVKQGLIESITGELPEKAWKITLAGFAVLQTAVVDLLGTPHSNARSFELGLANLHVLKPSQVRTALQNYRHDINTRIGFARHELDKEMGAGAKFQTIALYSHMLTMLEAEQTWLERFIADYDMLGLQDPVIPTPEIRPIPRIQQVVMPEDADSVHKETTLQNPNQKKSPRRPITPEP